MAYTCSTLTINSTRTVSEFIPAFTRILVGLVQFLFV